MRKISELFKKQLFISSVVVFFGTALYSLSVVWIIDMGKFYAGGVTGISQILQLFLEKFDISVTKSIFIAVFNVPLFIIGWKYVSKRFAYLSLASVGLQVLFTFLLEKVVRYNPFDVAGLNDNRLVLAIVGGALTGLSCGVILRFGASSGGMDTAAQFVALRTKIPFAVFQFTVDIIIIVVGAIVAGDIATAVYTVIRLILHLIVIDRAHTSYHFIAVKVTTIKPYAIAEKLLEAFPHGITMYEAEGMFLHTKRYVLESVVLNYEAAKYYSIARKIDPDVFIIHSKVVRIDGRYNKRTLT